MQAKSHLRDEIVGELYRTLVLLGADNGLLGTIGSWGESLPDEDVLANLRGWNQETLRESKSRIEHYEMTCRRQVYTQDEPQRIAVQAR
jgi:hypothetical protein